MKITRRSPRTGKDTTLDLDVTPEQMAELEGPRSQRRVVQAIFPNLSKAEREFLMTGYTQEDWDTIFPPDKL